MELYVIITIVAFIIVIIGSVYGWYKAYVKEELKLTELKEKHKKTVEFLRKVITELQLKIIELEKRKPHLPILLDEENND